MRSNKKQISVGLLLLFLAALPGCAGPKTTALDVEIAKAQAQAQRACYDAQSRQVAGMEAKDTALVIMARALANGKGDPCRTTSVYDARLGIAASQNAAAGQIVGNVLSTTAITAGILTAGNVLKSAVSNAGDRTSINGERNSYTAYDTRSDTDTRQWATGQGRNGNDAPTTGPDQTRTTTITLPQAEAAE